MQRANEKVKGLMSLVTEATYEISLLVNTDDIEKYVSSLNDEFSRENVFVKKQAKNGKEENFDIKPLIKSISIEAGNYNTILIKVNCLAGSKSNLNPNYIIQLIKIIIPEDELDDYNIHRTELLINT